MTDKLIPTKVKFIIVICIIVLFCFLCACAIDESKNDIDPIEEVTVTELSYQEQKKQSQEKIVQIQQEYKECEQKLIKLHEDADRERLYIAELDKEIYWTPETLKVMWKICEVSSSSPMCNNWEMLNDLMEVAEKRNVDYKLLLWIMYAESHIGANFNMHNCGQMNNWAWLKARKYDDWHVSEWYNEQYKHLSINTEWCWLYYFEDVHTFFESLANTISIWYGKCNEDVYCIMKSYVWHESGAWVRNVYIFKSL